MSITPEETAPLRPGPEIRAELQGVLERDQSRTGEVFRGLRRGLSADEIAGELGVGTSNFVWNYDRIARAVTEGDLPTSPSMALGAARKFRTLLRTETLSPPARHLMEVNLAELERRAEDPMARVIEVERAQVQTEEAESRNETGVYVYALPHYLRYPVDPVTGRTLMKVGRSDSDVIVRFRNQTRTTALPEEPILLRIYRTQGTDQSSSAEAGFHRLLEAADHHRSAVRTAGREWFLTSTRFTDEIANVMGLEALVVNDGEVIDAD